MYSLRLEALTLAHKAVSSDGWRGHEKVIEVADDYLNYIFNGKKNVGHR
jgi:hypothetical protein